MKKFSIIAIATVLASQVSAQEISISPELGLTYNGISQKINAESRNATYQFGARVGAMVDFQFGNYFSINPGLLFNINNGGQTYGEGFYYTGSNIPASFHDERTYRFHYLSLPLFFVLKTKNDYNDPHAFFGIGPSANFAIAGQYKQEYRDVVNGRTSVQNNSYSMPYGNNVRFDRARPFDLWANAFVGYQTSFGLYFKAQYGMGLLNLAPQGDANNYIRNSNFGVSVGYKIVARKQYSWM